MLRDKVAVVTGSTSGIGLGIARALTAEGAADGMGNQYRIKSVLDGHERVMRESDLTLC